MLPARLLTAVCIAAGVLAALRPAAAVGGDILVDPCRYDRIADAWAVWQALGDTPAVEAAEIDRRRATALPCPFADHPAMEAARWRRAMKVDLTGRLGVRLDVWCDASAALEGIDLALLDAQGRPVARGVVRPLPGWNTLAATAPPEMDAPTAERWAAIETLELAVHPARRGNTRLAIADVRIIGPDPLISLDRRTDRDCAVPRQGEPLAGSIRDETFRLNTLFGPVVLPAELVVGLEATDPGRSGVRVLTTDGQVVCGTLTDGRIRFELAGGELVDLPIGGLRQCAFRISPQRPAHPAPQAPVARVGDGRIALRFDDDFRFVLDTPHGPVALEPALLARLDALPDAPRRWEARLRGGSVLTGTLAEPSIPATWLLGAADQRPVTLTAGHVRQFRWPVTLQTPAAAAVARLRDDQVLYGQIAQPSLTIKGGFGAEAIDVKDIVAAAFSPVDLGMTTLTLYGGRTKRGPMLGASIDFRLLPDGPTVPVRVDHLLSIDAADAQSTDQFAARIDRLVRDLDVPEESDRLTACAELLRIGPAAAPLLRARLGHPNPVIRRALLEILAELE
ncbi:MAG: hypothetical protein GX591_17220 [Planctomycetes bacterium]|nr:hypothetical protein [Planctomycetota bacterium]